jgi:hypothetical protein
MQRSSGNVFRDLGFSDDEAENLRVRSDLMISLSKLIEERGLTQVQAAALSAGMPQGLFQGLCSQGAGVTVPFEFPIHSRGRICRSISGP